MYIIRKCRELINVFPDALVGGVEEVRAVAVYFNASLWLLLAVRISSDVRSAVNDDDAYTKPLGALLGDSQPKDACTNND